MRASSLAAAGDVVALGDGRVDNHVRPFTVKEGQTVGRRSSDHGFCLYAVDPCLTGMQPNSPCDAAFARPTAICVDCLLRAVL